MTKALAVTALAFSIAALLIGWVPLLGWLIWVAGLVLAIVALTKCKTPENGKNLAIAAIVIMCVSLLFLVMMTGMILAFFIAIQSDNITELETDTQFIPNSFTCSGGFSAEEFTVIENGVMLSVSNNIGVNVENIRIFFEQTQGGKCQDNIAIGPLLNGERTDLLTLCEQASFLPGEKIKADISVLYNKAGESLEHSAYCQLTSWIE